MSPRRATIEDLPLIIELAELHASLAGDGHPVDRDWLTTMATVGLTHTDKILFIDETGYAGAFVSPRFHTPALGASMPEIFIRPEARTLANIRAFINAAKTWAKAQGADSLRWSFERNGHVTGRVIKLG